ncbi:MAG: NnrU family protein, partial [Albimonas sp.]|uniref:NnrU family protein n=1 Tax=Albimonas sp. TaxID=1872425 RepID=UPI0040576E84
IGYRGAEFVNVWFPPAWGMHLTDLLMIFAVFLFGASHSKGNVKRHVRHPQLLAVIVWAASHLVVNGDLASLVLFGGLGLWAIVAIFATNARDGAWAKPAPAPRKKDLILVGITVVLYVVIGAIHALVGPSPFPGG